MSNNDLNDILERIYEEELVGCVLEELQCEHIKELTNRWEAQLPERFDSDNRRSVQVYKSSSLPSMVRSRGIKGNLYALIGYILYEIDDFESLKEFIFQIKVWVCNLFDWEEYLELGYDFSEEKKDHLAFLSPIREKRKARSYRNTSNINKKNEPIDIDTHFVMYDDYPHIRFVQDGIRAKTQREFGVMFDRDSERIVFPIHNTDGQVVGVKGRYVGSDIITEHERKYIFMYYPFDKSLELYNYHRAISHILEKKEVIVFESEKSCMLAWQYGYKHTVSTMGYELSPYQSYLLRKMGVNIIFAYDKGVEIDFIKKQMGSIKTRMCFYIDSNSVDELDDKDAPVDKGVRLWEKIYREKIRSL